MRYWCAQPVMHPPFDEDAGDLSRWTESGKALRRDKAFWAGTKKLRPGVHYKVIEPTRLGGATRSGGFAALSESITEYYTFPDEPFLDTFRHMWVIKRRPRPYVPILEGVPLPSPTKPAEDNARYLFYVFPALDITERHRRHSSYKQFRTGAE